MKTPEILIRMNAIFNDSEIVDVVRYYPTGSAYTCNPPSTDTDEDWLLCHLDGNFNALSIMLMKNGYEQGSTADQYPECVSFRKGRVNIILCFRQEFFDNWIKATEVCRNLNLIGKDQRKVVHHILCDEFLNDMMPPFNMGMGETP